MRFTLSPRQRPWMRRISPVYPMRKQLLAILPGLALALLATSHEARAQTDPASLPAHDVHQGLLVAVDPYIPADRYKSKFGKHTPFEAGVVALEVYFRNDTAAPLKIDLDSIRLLISAPGDPKQKLEPLAPDYVADLVLLKGKVNPRPNRRPLPLPGGAHRFSSCSRTKVRCLICTRRLPSNWAQRSRATM